MTKKNKRSICVGESVRIAVVLALKNFMQCEDQKEFEFPSSFTAVERAFVHNYCISLGLKSKSRGSRSNRYVTVYKNEGSTIVQADAVFGFCRASQQHALNLLQRHAVNAKEKQELLPPTERDRLLGQECRDVNRTTGRLSNGIPLVPPWHGDASEYQYSRQSLPIWPYRDNILQTMAQNQVVIVMGETGCGKTTQIPQFILEQCHLGSQACRIICTQPRRLAAISVAERVAAERDEKLGLTIGYQIRLESRISPKTILTFCTHGVLLRTLMGGDAALATVTHIIVDELHERDRFSDFLLVVLRDLLLKFRNLKLVLMSATLDVQLFVKYFGGCPVIEVPGKIHPVEVFYLEDVLKSTGYMTKAMVNYKKERRNSLVQRKNLASWCFQSVDGSGEACASSTKDRDSISNLGLGEDYLPGSPKKDFDLADIDPKLTAELDYLLQNAWVKGTDESFQHLLNFLLMERTLVDYQHSETSASALMVAAGRGKIEAVDQLLTMGANPNLKASNNWSAYDWANRFNQNDIMELLSCSTSKDSATGDLSSQEVEISDEDKELLEIYQRSFDDENVDHDLILSILYKIQNSKEEGAILIFLPGYDDIVKMRDKILSDDKHFRDNSRFVVYTLHSNMQCLDQKRIFKPAPYGTRKIILSTNIAETSVTINDVSFVIDSGKVKEKSFDSITGVTTLKSTWISRASAIQRRGRAGRCKPGTCYHLFSRIRFASFEPYQVPEILRVSIHELCLQAKLLAPPNIPIADFLARAADPPPFMVTRNAVTLLKTIDALDPWEELTEMGLHLLDLPIDPHYAKMVLYSVVLKCLDPILTIVSALSYKDPFILPSHPSQKQQQMMVKRKLAADTYSDHMALLRAFQAWQKARSDGHEKNFCEKHFLSSSTMEMIVGMRTQLLGQLRASGFVRARGGGDIRDLNSNSENWSIVKAALCAGTYPNLIRVDRERKQLITQKETKVRFHNSSVLNKPISSAKHTLSETHSKIVSSLPSDWLLFEEMTRCGRFASARTCTLVTPITVAIFGGPARLPLDALHEPDVENAEGYAEDSDSESEEKEEVHKSMLKLDEWISFRVEPEVGRLALQLRQKWHALFLRRMHAPSKPWSQVDEAVIRAIAGVLAAEEQSAGIQQPVGIGQRPRPMSTDYCPPVSLGPQETEASSPSASANQVFNRFSLLNIEGNESEEGSQMNYFGSKGSRGSPRKSKQDKKHSKSLDDRSDTSSVNSGASGTCSGSLTPCTSPAKNNTVLSRERILPASSSSKRFFIIKANNSKMVELSWSQNIWAFTLSTEKKLQWALAEGKEVILIFSTQGSGHFQGYARLTRETIHQKPQEFTLPNLGNCYVIEWIKKNNVSFQYTHHLQNPWNDNRRVQVSRDGQELEPSIGELVCACFESGSQNTRNTAHSASVLDFSGSYQYPSYSQWNSSTFERI